MTSNFARLQVTRVLTLLYTTSSLIALVLLTGMGMIDPMSVVAIVMLAVAWAVLYPSLYRAALREQYATLTDPTEDERKYTQVLSVVARRRERKAQKTAGRKIPPTSVRADVLGLAGWTFVVFVLLSYAQAMLAASLDYVG